MEVEPGPQEAAPQPEAKSTEIECETVSLIEQPAKRKRAAGGGRKPGSIDMKKYYEMRMKFPWADCVFKVGSVLREGEKLRVVDVVDDDCQGRKLLHDSLTVIVTQVYRVLDSHTLFALSKLAPDG